MRGIIQILDLFGLEGDLGNLRNDRAPLRLMGGHGILRTLLHSTLPTYKKGQCSVTHERVWLCFLRGPRTVLQNNRAPRQEVPRRMLRNRTVNY